MPAWIETIISHKKIAAGRLKMNEEITIRRACDKDIPKLMDILVQIGNIHNEIRPDLFKANCTKYTNDDLSFLIKDDKRPVFVAVNRDDEVLGHMFCSFNINGQNPVCYTYKTLYIDDLSIDARYRGLHIGHELMDYAYKYAAENGCYSVTLHVWTGNDNAQHFYESIGMKSQFTCMEKIL